MPVSTSAKIVVAMIVVATLLATRCSSREMDTSTMDESSQQQPSMESKVALVENTKNSLDGECPNDEAEMDSAEHISTPSQNKNKLYAADFGGTVAEELNNAVPGKATTANTASSSVTKQEESIESIGALIQDLLHSDNTKVNTALDALFLDSEKDKKKYENIQAVGGCFVLVQLLKNCLDKAIDEIPACDQVTELNELAELSTLQKTLNLITHLTFHHDESRTGISAIGGVEAVVKVMKTFPKFTAGRMWLPG